MTKQNVPRSTSDDSDDLAVALETARVQEERDDLDEAVRWLQKAAGIARKQGRPDRAGELSRAAVQLRHVSDGSGKFEKRPDAEQVLSDIDEDDFSDETIVESASNLSGRSQEPDFYEAPDTVPAPRPTEDIPTKQLLPGGTPIAPGSVRQEGLAHQAIRVAVRKGLSGKFEARPLGAGDTAASGEEEALLVALSPSSKLI